MRAVTLTLTLATFSLAHAEEGMWMPEQMADIVPAWQERGLKLDVNALSDPMGAPLGAIVSLGFCSASFVSPDGLIATNHHCVERFLQYASDDEANRHRDGFTATSRADERHAGPDARLRIVDAIEDVTDKVLEGIKPRTPDAKRVDLISNNRKALVDACEASGARCSVVSHYGASTYRLVRSTELRDVRVVYAPPMSVGQFGGDIDNWMWPRHSADFALLRAYTGPDGAPADHADENIPYKPPVHLSLSTEGIAADDVVMVAGFPGRTNRHARAEVFAWYSTQMLPLRQELLAEMIHVLGTFTDQDPKVDAKLGPALSSLNNGYKNGKGLLDAMSRTDLVGPKRATEASFLDWVQSDPRRRRSLKRPISDLDAAEAQARTKAMQDMIPAMMLRSVDLLSVARTAVRRATEAAKPDAERDEGFRDRDLPRIRARFDRLDASLHPESDRALFEMLLDRYDALPAEQRVPPLDALLAKHGSRDAALDALYASTDLTRAEARRALLDADLATLRSATDPWVALAVALEDWDAPRREADKALDGRLQRLRAVWFEAWRDWHIDRGAPLYDDANSTLRISIGVVEGYPVADGLLATPQTRLSGLIRKVGPAPFDAPAALVERAQRGPEHPLADPALGDVPVNFLSTLDITGGNSGSAILDAQGRLIGLAFDGNWESIASDWIFDREVARCIGVDLRYMLWDLEGQEGSAWVLEELGYNRR